MKENYSPFCFKDMYGSDTFVNRYEIVRALFYTTEGKFRLWLHFKNKESAHYEFASENDGRWVFNALMN